MSYDNGVLSIPKKVWAGGIAIILLFALLLSAGRIFETVEKGTYQIKQAAITGEMSAHMNPGLYMQNFGDVQTWSKAETFYFTADDEEGSEYDQSIEVRFNDGSLCDISGTTRIVMPADGEDALALVVTHGYRSFEDLELKLILPTVRNALRLTANLMSARESYSEKRADFVSMAWDQIQNGLYKTTNETRKVEDVISGEFVTKTFKVIKMKQAVNADGSLSFDKAGDPILTDEPEYQANPLGGLNITLDNFEVKVFNYSDTVTAQISAQQASLMAVETAKAKAAEAEQDALTAEAEGLARVKTAQFKEEEKKIQAVVEAEKLKRVAELDAEKNLEVAKLNRKAAVEIKQQQILLGEGEAARKAKVMKADGALDKKLAVYKEVNFRYAEALGKNKLVPEVMMGAGGTATTVGSGATNLIDLLTIKTAKDLGLDMRVPKGQ
jgi:regulator of protease activity HflC (stomatin/prohibitin superfamily)